MPKRTHAREEYLSDLLSTAIEHSGYGFPGVLEYKWSDEKPATTYAVIYDRYEEDGEVNGFTPKKTWRVDIDMMAKGLGIIRKRGTEGYAEWVRDLILSDRTNGNDGDYDVIGALYVLENAIFGEGTYS